jgi:glycosyltransferase 2 family protein
VKLPWAAIGLVAVLIVAAIALVRLDFGMVLTAIGSLDLTWGLIGVLAYIVAQVAFAARWFALIDPQFRPSPTATFRYTLVGAMLNAVLPMRGGDVARAVILSRGHSIPLGDAGGTVAAERLADALTVVLLGAWLGTRLVLPAMTIQTLIVIAVIAVVAVVVAAWLLKTGLAERLVAMAPGRLAARLTNGVAGFRSAASRLTDVRVLLLAGAAHALGWLVVLVALMSFLIGLHLTVPPIDGALSVLVLTNLGGMFVQVPAGLGTWHMLAVAALSLWGIAPEAGVAYALLAHTFGIAVPVIGGLLATIGSTMSSDALRKA